MGQNWTDCFPCPHHGGYSCPEGCTGDSPAQDDVTTYNRDEFAASEHKVALNGCRGIFVAMLFTVVLAVCAFGAWHLFR